MCHTLGGMASILRGTLTLPYVAQIGEHWFDMPKVGSANLPVGRSLLYY